MWGPGVLHSEAQECSLGLSGEVDMPPGLWPLRHATPRWEFPPVQMPDLSYYPVRAQRVSKDAANATIPRGHPHLASRGLGSSWTPGALGIPTVSSARCTCWGLRVLRPRTCGLGRDGFFRQDACRRRFPTRARASAPRERGASFPELLQVPKWRDPSPGWGPSSPTPPFQEAGLLSHCHPLSPNECSRGTQRASSIHCITDDLPRVAEVTSRR